MPQQVATTLENNFTGGLKTEYTALNFPENACTDVDNCVFSIFGEVSRRGGFDLEDNYLINTLTTRAGKAISRYKWRNVGGDGNTRVFVLQIGNTLYFFRYSDTTDTNPISRTKLAATVNLADYQVSGAASPSTFECDYADGNGYLFVYHPCCNPFYCKYSSGSITPLQINVKIRDFTGVIDNMPVEYRPTSPTGAHNYELLNRGWYSSPGWSSSSTTTVPFGTGSKVFTVDAGLTATGGQSVVIQEVGNAFGNNGSMSGTVTTYVGTTLTVNVTSTYNIGGSPSNWIIYPVNLGLMNTWVASQGNQPSRADIWWRFKDKDGVFDPATTAPNVTLGRGEARNGFYVLDAFNQDRATTSGVANLTVVSTTARPKTGCWFQGRVWFAGANGAQAASGTAEAYSWSETILFSQIVETTAQFGMCYQNNDPTSEDFPDLLPSDGGLIRIQGCGSIHKLFPVQNGLLIHADNGIWFIRGNQGIGFTANDYTITKISSVNALSASSFIDVNGWPIFWNEDGIYAVNQNPQNGVIEVNNICLGSIQSFYSDIPSQSKVYARGDYDPIHYKISWVYRSDTASSLENRYTFDRVLNFDTSLKAFYPYSLNTDGPKIIDLSYINSPGGTLSPPAVFKYLTAITATTFTFSEVKDTTNWVDFHSATTSDYTSYFITGYKLHGKAVTKFQPIYVTMFSNAERATAYKIQGIWDFANSGNSGRYSNIQMITNALTRFGTAIRRHKIRGRGMSLQLKVTSVDGLPFSILGWSSLESINSSI